MNCVVLRNTVWCCILFFKSLKNLTLLRKRNSLKNSSNTTTWWSDMQCNQYVWCCRPTSCRNAGLFCLCGILRLPTKKNQVSDWMIEWSIGMYFIRVGPILRIWMNEEILALFIHLCKYFTILSKKSEYIICASIIHSP